MGPTTTDMRGVPGGGTAPHRGGRNGLQPRMGRADDDDRKGKGRRSKGSNRGEHAGEKHQGGRTVHGAAHRGHETDASRDRVPQEKTRRKRVQPIERQRDRQQQRTDHRPIQDGRRTPNLLPLQRRRTHQTILPDEKGRRREAGNHNYRHGEHGGRREPRGGPCCRSTSDTRDGS